MTLNYREIWIYASLNNECLENSVLGLVAKARNLIKNKTGWRICAVMLGKEISSSAKELSKYVDQVYAFSGRDFTHHDAMLFAAPLASMLKEKRPEILLFHVSNFNSVLAATLGVRLQTGVIAHAVDISLNDNDQLIATIPAFGGQYMGDILCPNHMPQIASVHVSGVIPPALPQNGDISLIPISVSESPYKYLGEIQLEREGQTLENAEVIVCGGLGVGSAQNWVVLEEVAKLLGATVACTRPPIDEEWGVDEEIMIGTSGKCVSPKVYIGFGVSGTSHHICGMRDSGKIFNINTDENAPSLALSDYAVVGDAEEFLCALRDNLRVLSSCRK